MSKGGHVPQGIDIPTGLDQGLHIHKQGPMSQVMESQDLLKRSMFVVDPDPDPGQDPVTEIGQQGSRVPLVNDCIH